MSEVKTLIENAASTGQKGGRLVGYGIGRDKCTLQVDVTLGGGTITYTIEGRLDVNYQWRTIAGPYTDSVITPMESAPLLQVNVTAQTGAAKIDRAGVIMR